MDNINNAQQEALDERRKYISAFNSTMIKIWKERIALLRVVDTGRLYNSVIAISMQADAKFLDVSLSQQFIEYGIYQNYGTGRETPIGNPGDLGHDKVRKARRWFSIKYFASVMNVKEFLADNIAKDFCGVIATGLDKSSLKASVTQSAN